MALSDNDFYQIPLFAFHWMSMITLASLSSFGIASTSGRVSSHGTGPMLIGWSCVVKADHAKQ